MKILVTGTVGDIPVTFSDVNHLIDDLDFFKYDKKGNKINE